MTPDTTPTYAGFWKRVAAYLIDYVVLIVPTFGAALLITMTTSWGLEDVDTIDAAAAGVESLALLAGLVITWLYYAGMESSTRQATLGKRALGIRVTDEHGERLSFARASGRFFGMFLSVLVLGLGFLMVAFTRRKQGLHDLLVGALVVNGVADTKPAL